MVKGKKESRPLTVEEKVEEAINHLKGMRFVTTPLPSIPADFPLHLGDYVEIGNLDDATVFKICDPYVVIHHKTVRMTNRYSGEQETESYSYGCWYWWDMVPHGKVKDYDRSIQYGKQFSLKRPDHVFTTTSMESLLRRACCNELHDNPEYQRGYVWTDQDKENFITSVFEYIDLGKFVTVKYDWPNNRVEVLDGKQRLNCISDFVLGKFKYKGMLWWEISRADRYTFKDRTIQIAELDGSRLKLSDRLFLFLQVNAGGVPQTEEHLARVRDLWRESIVAELADE